MTLSAPARRLRICFVAPNAYGALSGNATKHSGGIEKQTSLWSRWFAHRGHDVQLVSWDEGQKEGQRIDGVLVRKFCRVNAGLPGLRYFVPRWSSLVAALRRADADVYHYMNGDSKLGQMALWTRLRGRVLTYYVSSNRSIEPTLPNLEWREKPLYRYGLRSADRVMVQTQVQQRNLARAFGVDSTVLGMPCEEIATDPAAASSKAGQPPVIFWVGRISPEKRFEWLLDLAEACPEMRFEVAGAPNTASEYADALWQRAKRISNVVLHGRIASPIDMAALYRRASLLCCTSSSEGFPNTFLEAWSHSVPVVTTFDPEGIVAQRKLGAVATDVAGLGASIRALLGSPASYLEAAQTARAYYENYHRPDTVLGRVEASFIELAGS